MANPYPILSCPECHQGSSVLEKNTRADGSIWRRYKCPDNHRFSTIEREETLVRQMSTREGMLRVAIHKEVDRIFGWKGQGWASQIAPKEKETT
jgi:hypothetical protein